MKQSKEQIETTFRAMKEHILESKILLSPRFYMIPVEMLDDIIERSINLTVNEDGDEEDKIALKIFMLLTVNAMKVKLKEDEGFNNRIYDSFMSGDMDKLSDDYKGLVSRLIKDGLISHEQYEKIKGVDDKIKDI